jgi:hypothetical protein
MSVAEFAQLLNVSNEYATRILIRKRLFRPIVVVGGRRYVLRSKAKAYHRKRKKIARRALRQLARLSQEGRMYP